MAPPAIARSRLVADLRALGLREGSAVLVHARMSALGWVVGGSGAVVSALLEALGPEGTLMAYASWQEHVYHAGEWPEEHRAAYLAEPPVFDPASSPPTTRSRTPTAPTARSGGSSRRAATC